MQKQLCGRNEMRLVDDVDAAAVQSLAEDLMKSRDSGDVYDGTMIKWIMEELKLWEEEETKC